MTGNMVLMVLQTSDNTEELAPLYTRARWRPGTLFVSDHCGQFSVFTFQIIICTKAAQ